MDAETTGTDIVRRQFPEPDARGGARLLRRVQTVTLEPVRNDRRLLVYPVAIMMAIAIGVLGHALAPGDEASAGADVAASSSASIAVTDRDVLPADNLSVPTSDGGPADPSPRTR